MPSFTGSARSRKRGRTFGGAWFYVFLTENHIYGNMAQLMKTTLDLPDELMTAVKIKAAKENRKMKDIIADSLRRDLGILDERPRKSIGDLRPVSAGTLIDTDTEDRMGDMLDARGHRY